MMLSYTPFLNELVADIARAYQISYFEDFNGCTEDQIQRTMEAQGVTRLPALYHQFLLRMGRGFRNQRVDYLLWSYPALRYFKRDTVFVVPHGAFIFALDPFGEWLFYFYPADGDDPPIYHWDEDGAGSSREVLSQFLRGYFSGDEDNEWATR